METHTTKDAIAATTALTTEIAFICSSLGFEVLNDQPTLTGIVCCSRAEGVDRIWPVFRRLGIVVKTVRAIPLQAHHPLERNGISNR
jgi:hypothetical protein